MTEPTVSAGLLVSLYPLDRGEPVRSVDELLTFLATIADSRGRYWGDARFVRAACWWEPSLTPEQVEFWLTELQMRGDITRSRFIHNAYDEHLGLGLTIQDLTRFARFTGRLPIPVALRRSVYERDGHRCVTCGASDPLSLDHIVPWSRGGPDTFENLQTLCRPCNSRKGARV